MPPLCPQPVMPTSWAVSACLHNNCDNYGPMKAFDGVWRGGGLEGMSVTASAADNYLQYKLAPGDVPRTDIRAIKIVNRYDVSGDDIGRQGQEQSNNLNVYVSSSQLIRSGILVAEGLRYDNTYWTGGEAATVLIPSGTPVLYLTIQKPDWNHLVIQEMVIYAECKSASRIVSLVLIDRVLHIQYFRPRYCCVSAACPSSP